MLQPRFIPRFAFTVDYCNIKLDGAIQGFGADAILDALRQQLDRDVHRRLVRPDPPRPGGSIWLSRTAS